MVPAVGQRSTGLTPTAWRTRIGSEASECWTALPFWDVISGLDLRLHKLERSTALPQVREGAVRSAYLASFITSAATIAGPAVHSAAAARGLDPAAAATELWDSMSVRAREFAAVDRLRVVRARLLRLAAVYERAAERLLGNFGGRVGREIGVVDDLSVLGDMHARGAVVLFYRNDAPLSVYKPRSMAIDIALSTIFTMLEPDSQGAAPRHPTSLDFGDHGVQQFVAYSSPDPGVERSLFFRRAGGLVALAWALSITDLHSENVKCAGDSPIIVDAECALNFDPRMSVRLAEHRFMHRPQTVLTSMLLPNWIKQFRDTEAFDPSALGAFPHPAKQVPHRVLVRGDAGIGYEYRAPQTGFSLGNLPTAEGGVWPVTGYEDDVLAGYDAMATSLSKKSIQAEIIRALDAKASSLRSRYVHRSTSVYATQLTSADLHNDSPSDGSLDAWLRKQEAVALDQGVIPLFERAFETPVLFSDGGGARPTEEAPRDSVRRSLALLDAAAFGSQRPLVERSLLLGGADPYWAGGDLVNWSLNSRGEATSIRELVTLLEKGRLGSGCQWWWPLGLQHSAARWQLTTTSAGLYDGLAGIAFAVSVAALDCREARGPAERMADALMAQLDAYFNCEQGQQTGRWSLANGPLGAMLAISAVPGVKRSTLDRVVAWGASLADSPEEIRNGDFIEGAAGVLTAAVRLHELTGAPTFAALAQRAQGALADLLARAAQNARLLPGFAHGLSGMAFALWTARAIAADSVERHEAIRRCLLLEDELLARPRDPHAVPGDTASASWCWGAVGLLQARLAVDECRGEWDRLRSRVLADRRMAVGLCHGILGSAMLQGSASYRSAFGEGDYRDTSSEIDRYLASGFVMSPDAPSYATDPTLFTGTAGLLLHRCALRDNASFVLPELRYGAP